MERKPEYVVVGAGAGGCVLARRLLDAGARVLVLEAGGRDNHLFVTAPAAFSRLFKTRHDWAFFTEPQRELFGRRLYWPRGKVLGGSTAINATIYIRGSRRDFAAWGEGWSWDDVLPAYRSIERYSGVVSDSRGTSGELPVGHRSGGSHDLSGRFLDSAAQRMGIPQVQSFNDGVLEGTGLFESNHLRGERWSAFRAFLKPKLGDPKLTVLTGAQATKLLWDGNRVTGVQFMYQGQLRQVQAGGVVLAGGTVNTPQLLMLSGVGPRAELTRHGIAVRQHLPGVGQNLQDHPATAMIYRSRLPTLDAQLTDQAVIPYLLGRKGALTSNVAEAGAFIRSNAGLDSPDLQYHFAPAYFREHGFQRQKGEYFTLGPVLVAPQSRGEIGLHSADPFAAPRIDPRYLSDNGGGKNSRDLAALVSGLELAREITATGPLAEARGEEILPAGLDLQGYVRREMETLYHPVGTCALGEGENSVTSRQLAVHGARGLWIADASVMPQIIHANTNATSMMIGERAAQFILQDA